MLSMFFKYMLAICMSSLEKCIFRLPIFKSGWVFFFCYWVLWVLYVFWILTPYQIYDLKTFFPFSRLPFHFCCGVIFSSWILTHLYALAYMLSHLVVFNSVTQWTIKALSPNSVTFWGTGGEDLKASIWWKHIQPITITISGQCVVFKDQFMELCGQRQWPQND